MVRRVKISSSVLVAHAKALQLTPTKYPITRVDVKVLTIAAGVQGESLDNIFLGQLRKGALLGSYLIKHSMVTSKLIRLTLKIIK